MSAPRGDGRSWTPPAPQPDHTDWGQVVAEGAYRTYHVLRRALVHNAVGPGAAPAFHAALGAARAGAVDDLLAQLDGPGRAAAVRDLHRELIVSEPDSELLLSYLRRRITRSLKTADPGNRAPAYAWPVSTCCYAAVRAYEATRDRRYLNLVAETFEGILPFRDRELGRSDQCRGRIGAGWGGTQFAKGKYTTNITTAGRIAYPIVLLHRVVEQGERLRRVMRDQVRGHLAVIEEVLADLDDDFVAVGDEGFYPRPGTARPEPVNHMAWAGAAFLELHAATGSAAYLDRAGRVARFLYRSLRDDGAEGVVWGYAPSPRDRDGGPERVWKAQVTTQFMTAAARHGVEFERDDLRRIAATILRNVFLADGRLNTRIDRVVEPFDSFGGKVHGGMGSVVGMLELEPYAPGLRKRIVDLVADDPGVGGWFGTAPGAVGYTRLLATPGVPLV